MQISRKRKRPLPSEILVSRKNDHAKVYAGDQLKVQTDLQTKFPVSLMIEKCWLGNHPNANEPRLAVFLHFYREGQKSCNPTRSKFLSKVQKIRILLPRKIRQIDILLNFASFFRLDSFKFPVQTILFCFPNIFCFLILSRSLINPNWLIYEGCPLNENVTMFPVPIGTNPGFTFQITNAHSKMNQLYVFCLIGICTPNPGQSNGNIPKVK